MKHTLKTIRCKRPDDVIVVKPGPDAPDVASQVIRGATCGHGHLVVIGNPQFVSRDALPKMPDEVGKAALETYQENPLARVLVETVADQLGVQRQAIAPQLVCRVLGHQGLLQVLEEGREAVKKRAAAPKLFLPAGVERPQ